MMKTYKVYTGPTLVQGMAARLRAAGLFIKLEGTAHVYVEAANRENVLAMLNNWTWRDVQEMPE